MANISFISGRTGNHPVSIGPGVVVETATICVFCVVEIEVATILFVTVLWSM